MTQSIEIKGTVLSEKFNEKFADLVMKPGNLKSVFCLTYKNESGVYLSDYMDLFKRSNVDIDKYFDFSEIVSNHFLFTFNVVDGSNSYLFDIDFSDCELYLCIKDNKDNELDSYVLRFHEEAFYSFFSQTEEESTSESEHPEEDAEEQSEMIDTNMGAMPIEDYREIRAIQYGFDSYEDFRKAGYYLNIDKPNISEPELPAEENKQGVELTPLELILFQHYKEILEYYSFLLSIYRAAASDEESNNEEIIKTYRSLALVDRFEAIISDAELVDKFDLWLAECEKHEALTVL